MALLSWRTFVNKSGTSYDALATTKPFAEDLNKVSACFVEGSTETKVRFQNVTNAEKLLLTAYVGLVIYNTDASRLEVYTGSSWTAIGTSTGGASVPKNKRGSDCSGVEGTGRTLTLDNTDLTIGTLVFINGACLHVTDFSTNHLATNSIITFNNYVWDADYIIVVYYT